MRSARRAVAFAVALAAAGVASVAGGRSARADTPPSVWDIAKDPAARERWQLHVEVRRLLVPDPMPVVPGLPFFPGGLAERERSLETARALLEQHDAVKSPDPVLRFDLGMVYQHLRHYEAAIQVLDEALKMAPTHPAAEEAWIELAYAHSHLDHPKEERAAYRHYLELASRPSSRATALLNLGESEMRLGNLEDAIADFREVVHIASGGPLADDYRTSILGVWDLAVALDRAGDPQGAAVEARRAQNMDLQRVIEDKEYVFFVPEHERLWYIALGKVEVAKQAADPVRAERAWRSVEQTWATYVHAAEATRHENDTLDRWLPLAKAHLAQARAQREAAERRVRAMPKPAPGSKKTSPELPDF